MTNKIVLKNQSNKIIEITSKKLILNNQYCTVQQVQVQVEGSKNTQIMYKLLSSANPYMSLYQLYSLYALQTPVEVTRQFIRFAVKCWKSYQQLDKKQKFIHDFFESSYIEKIQASGTNEVFLAVRNVLCLSPKLLNSAQLQSYFEQYKTSEQLVRSSIKSNLAIVAKESKQYEQLSSKLKYLPTIAKQSARNLENINIIHTQQKFKLLERICVKLPKQWKVQLLLDQKNKAAYILANNMLKQNEEIIPFQDYLHPYYHKQSDLKQFQVQQLAFEVIGKLQDYNKKCPFPLGMNPENFIVIVSKQQNTYTLSKTKCQIIYISPIIEHFGLNRLKPTAENKIVFESRYQPLHNKFDFRKQLQISINSDKIYDTNNAIKWMIYFDHIFCKLFGKGKTSLLESYSTNNRKWEEDVLDKIADHQNVQNEKYLFHSWTICVLDSLLNDFAPLKSDNKEQILSILTPKNLRHIFFNQQKRTIEQKYPQNPSRADLLLKILEFQSNLYFSQDVGIRPFLLHNKVFSQLSSQKRYMCLYFLAKLTLLNILLILSLFQTKQQLDKLKIQQSYKKFDNITQKLSEKVTQYRTNENDQNTTQQRKLYDSLQKITIQKQIYSDKQKQQTNLQSLIKDTRQKLDILMQVPRSSFAYKFQNLKVRSEKQNIKKNSLISTKSCFLTVSIFTHLNIHNFVDFIFLEKQIRDIKNKQKVLTSTEIYDKLSSIQGKLPIYMINKSKNYTNSIKGLSKAK